MFRVKQIVAALSLCLLSVFGYTPTVQAAQSNSTNYGVSEVNFGSGGSLRSCSTAYCSKQSAGELAVGNTADAAPQILNNTPTADAYILSTNGTTNFGSANPLRASSVTNRSLLKFDTSSIPANATITSVRLQIYSTNSLGGAYRVHEALDSWTEAGVTWNNQPTWNSTVLASSGIATTNTSLSITLPASSVVRAGNTNYGLDYSTSGVVGLFSSREDGTNPPRLIVDYEGANQARGGFNTDREPVLEMTMAGASISLGVLDAVSTKSGSATFSVRTFPASGYVVIVDGVVPRNTTGHTLSALSTSALSQTGVEQFGVNLRDNSTPNVGADAVKMPDSTFAYGAAATGYDAPNNYKYVNGQTIAQSAKGAGQTDYTLSVIVNISANTPAGAYAGLLSLIAVPTF